MVKSPVRSSVSVVDNVLIKEFHRESARMALGQRSRVTSSRRWVATGLSETAIVPLVLTRLIWAYRPPSWWWSVVFGYLVVWAPIASYTVGRVIYPMSPRRLARSVPDNKVRDYALLAVIETWLLVSFLLTVLAGPRGIGYLFNPLFLVLLFVGPRLLRRWIRPRLLRRYRQLGLDVDENQLNQL